MLQDCICDGIILDTKGASGFGKLGGGWWHFVFFFYSFPLSRELSFFWSATCTNNVSHKNMGLGFWEGKCLEHYWEEECFVLLHGGFFFFGKANKGIIC